MKKKLLVAGKLEPYICLDSHKIYVDETMILTPGAKDELSSRKITIVRGTKPEPVAPACEPCKDTADSYAKEECHHEETHCADENNFVYAVAAMLKEEYGIEDLEVLKALSCKLAETIKANI